MDSIPVVLVVVMVALGAGAILVSKIKYGTALWRAVVLVLLAAIALKLG